MDVTQLSSVPPWEWPADAGEVLLRALSPDASSDEVRHLAVDLASSTTVMNDDLARALLAILRDPAEAEEIRGAAAISLGPTLEELDLDEFGDPTEAFDEEALITAQVAEDVCGALRQLYLDAGIPKFVRRRALEASVRAQLDWHHAAVRAAYHSGDHDWRLTAVFCMRFVSGFEREIVEALDSGDPELRCQAIRAAGSWGVDAAWRHVHAALTAGVVDKALLLAAIEAVPGIRPGAAATVLASLAGSEDEEIADAVAEALVLAGTGDDPQEAP